MKNKLNFRKNNIIDDENVKTIKTELKHDKLEYLKMLEKSTDD